MKFLSITIITAIYIYNYYYCNYYYNYNYYNYFVLLTMNFSPECKQEYMNLTHMLCNVFLTSLVAAVRPSLSHLWLVSLQPVAAVNHKQLCF